MTSLAVTSRCVTTRIRRGPNAPVDQSRGCPGKLDGGTYPWGGCQFYFGLPGIAAGACGLELGVACLLVRVPERPFGRGFGFALAFGVLAAAAGNAMTIDDTGCADVSYPGFWRELERVQA